MKIIFDETRPLPTTPVAYKACCYPMAEAMAGQVPKIEGGNAREYLSLGPLECISSCPWCTELISLIGTKQPYNLALHT